MGRLVPAGTGAKNYRDMTAIEVADGEGNSLLIRGRIPKTNSADESTNDFI